MAKILTNISGSSKVWFGVPVAAAGTIDLDILNILYSYANKQYTIDLLSAGSATLTVGSIVYSLANNNIPSATRVLFNTMELLNNGTSILDGADAINFIGGTLTASNGRVNVTLPGGAIIGPPTYPITMSRTSSGNDLYMQYGGTIPSETIPWIMPFNSRSLAVTFSTLTATQIQMRIYKNSNLTTPIYDYTTPSSPLTKSVYVSIPEGQPGYFQLTAGDALTFRGTKIGSGNPNLSNPAMVLWLQNTT